MIPRRASVSGADPKVVAIHTCGQPVDDARASAPQPATSICTELPTLQPRHPCTAGSGHGWLKTLLIVPLMLRSVSAQEVDEPRTLEPTGVPEGPAMRGFVDWRTHTPTGEQGSPGLLDDAAAELRRAGFESIHVLRDGREPAIVSTTKVLEGARSSGGPTEFRLHIAADGASGMLKLTPRDPMQEIWRAMHSVTVSEASRAALMRQLEDPSLPAQILKFDLMSASALQLRAEGFLVQNVDSGAAMPHVHQWSDKMANAIQKIFTTAKDKQAVAVVLTCANDVERKIMCKPVVDYFAQRGYAVAELPVDEKFRATLIGLAPMKDALDELVEGHVPDAVWLDPSGSEETDAGPAQALAAIAGWASSFMSGLPERNTAASWGVVFLTGLSLEMLRALRRRCMRPSQPATADSPPAEAHREPKREKEREKRVPWVPKGAAGGRPPSSSEPPRASSVHDSNPRIVAETVSKEIAEAGDKAAYLHDTVARQFESQLWDRDEQGKRTYVTLDGGRVATAAGILCAVLKSAPYPIVAKWMSEKGIDFWSVRQTVLDVIETTAQRKDLNKAEQESWLTNLRIAAMELGEWERLLRMKEAEIAAPLEPGRLGPASRQRPRAATSSAARPRKDSPPADPGLGVNFVYGLAKKWAGTLTPGGRAERAAVILMQDVFVPGVKAPHFHVTKDFFVFKTADGDHLELARGDKWNVNRIMLARQHLEPGNNYHKLLLNFLDSVEAEAASRATRP